jgi:hypothetical protein
MEASRSTLSEPVLALPHSSVPAWGTLGAAGVAIAVPTLAFTALEGWHPITAMYFSVAMLSTVGYGDIVPSNAISR